MSRTFCVFIATLCLAACAGAPSAPPSAAVAELARELARRLGVPVELVPVTSAGQAVETLKAGRVAVGNKSAYDLFLTRELKKAKIERAPTSPAVVDYFIANRLEVAAGVKQQLELDAKRLPGLRLLPGRFMVINQAMGMRLGRAAGAQYLSAFVEDMKASGFVAEALRRHAIEGAAVAPAGNLPG